jgi:hypothetical protein
MGNAILESCGETPVRLPWSCLRNTLARRRSGHASQLLEMTSRARRSGPDHRHSHERAEKCNHPRGAYLAHHRPEGLVRAPSDRVGSRPGITRGVGPDRRLLGHVHYCQKARSRARSKKSALFSDSRCGPPEGHQPWRSRGAPDLRRAEIARARHRGARAGLAGLDEGGIGCPGKPGAAAAANASQTSAARVMERGDRLKFLPLLLSLSAGERSSTDQVAGAPAAIPTVAMPAGR